MHWFQGRVGEDIAATVGFPAIHSLVLTGTVGCGGALCTITKGDCRLSVDNSARFGQVKVVLVIIASADSSKHKMCNIFSTIISFTTVLMKISTKANSASPFQ